MKMIIPNPADKSETGIDCFADKWGACKICQGEIPYGHLNDCYLYTQEKEIKRLKELGFEEAVVKNSLKTEVSNLKLVVGRYQFMWEAAQLCINKIDDYFEYQYLHVDKLTELQTEVRKHLKIYTEAVSGLLKKRHITTGDVRIDLGVHNDTQGE